MMSSEYPTPRLYIAGKWRTASGNSQDVIDPASGMSIGAVPLADEADLSEALEAADRGFKAWRATPGETRAAVLSRAAALIRERAKTLAAIASREQGKPLAEALGEAGAAAAILEFHAGEAVRIYGRVLPRPSGWRSLVVRQPIGPVAAFCAWNFPLINVVRKLSPALAAGCSVILKPSEATPASANAVMQCLIDAGLPGDVAQIVFGVPDKVSRQLLASPITRKLSFTGSVSVGKHLLGLAANTVMKSTMELGGHAPVLVFDDCDVEKTLDTLVGHKFRNAGQVCISPTRFFVHEAIHDRFAAGFAERARALRVGLGSAADTQMGPMANARRPDVIERLVADAVGRGAHALAGGSRIGNNGYFYQPTVLSGVPLDAEAMNQEPFGPLALMHPFSTLDQAVDLANRLPFGLASYCFTENGRRQMELGERIEAGMVCINNVRTAWPDAPFLGIKESGFGSEDGPEGIEAHMITKAIHAC